MGGTTSSLDDIVGKYKKPRVMDREPGPMQRPDTLESIMALLPDLPPDPRGSSLRHLPAPAFPVMRQFPWMHASFADFNRIMSTAVAQIEAPGPLRNLLEPVPVAPATRPAAAPAASSKTATNSKPAKPASNKQRDVLAQLDALDSSLGSPWPKVEAAVGPTASTAQPGVHDDSSLALLLSREELAKVSRATWGAEQGDMGSG